MTQSLEGRPVGHRARHGDPTDGSTNPFETYDEKMATAELRRYRKSGPRPWTRALVAALKSEGVRGATLLDIGGGIGAVQHELLAAGAVSATSVDASSAYLAAAQEESERRGLTERITYHRGDFVDLASSVAPADIVTLERVLNVYPDWERLASLSAERARRLYGIVIPRNTPFVKMVISTINLMLRLKHKRLRAAVVPIEAIDQLLETQGLRRQSSTRVGPAWQMAIYRREN